MIIDCHTHLNRYSEKQKPTLKERIEELELEMRRNRIDSALILSSYLVNDDRPSTSTLVEATKDKAHFAIVAGLSISHTKEDLESLRSPLRDGHVVGLKIYPGYEPFYPFDSRLSDMYDLAEEFSVPVMVHTGDTYAAGGKVKYSHPLHIDEIAVDRRKVNFVICHMGNPWFTDTTEIVYKNPNVYADLSGLVLGDFSDRFEKYMADKLQEIVLFGVEPSKLLYGTDWPIASMRSYLNFIDDIRIPIKEKKAILYSNAAKLFKLSEKHSLFEARNT
jgi:predicted TIM-barrel fold metal-dependent hydrolase